MTLCSSGEASHDAHAARPRASTSDASSVAAASRPSPARRARAAARRARKTCGVCTAHSRERSSVADDAPVRARLLDRVGHRRRGDRRVAARPRARRCSARPGRGVDAAAARRRARPRRSPPAPPPARARTDSERIAPPAHASPGGVARTPRGSATTTRSHDRAQHVQAPLEHAAGRHKRRTPWALGPKAFAAAGRGNDPDDRHRSCRYAGRRRAVAARCARPR